MARDLLGNASSQIQARRSQNPWVTGLPTGRFIESELVESKRNELLERAYNLLPDYELLSGEIQKKDLSPADKMNFNALLNNVVANYSSKFEENPYWVFSREGRAMTQQLQSIVRNPVFEILESLNKSSEQAFSLAKDDDNLGEIVIDNNGVLVYDFDKKRLRKVQPDKVSANMQPMTYQDAAAYLRTHGFYKEDGSVEEPLTYAMSKYKDVISDITSLFSDLGSTQVEYVSKLKYDDAVKQLKDLHTGLKKVSTNSKQIQKVLENILVRGLGLPDSHLNTLYARELRKQMSENMRDGQMKPFDMQKAHKNIVDTIINIAEGKYKYSEDFSEISALSPNAGDSKATAEVGFYESLFQGIGGEDITYNIPDSGKTVPAYKLPGAIFSSYLSPNTSIKSGLLLLPNNEVYQTLKKDGAQLTAMDGTPINEHRSFPVPDSAIIYQDPELKSKPYTNANGEIVQDPVYWLTFKVLSSDSGESYDFSDVAKAAPGTVQEPSPEAKRYYENIRSYNEKLYDEGYVPHQKTKSLIDNYGLKVVTVKVMIDPRKAAELSRLILDKKDMYVPRTAQTIGFGSNIETQMRRQVRVQED